MPVVFWSVLAGLSLLACLGCASIGPRDAPAQAPRAQASPGARWTPTPRDSAIWREFVTRLRAGGLTTADIDPYPELATFEGFKDTLLGFLRNMRSSARWHEWEVPEEVHRVGDNVHYLARLTEGNASPAEYVFTFRDAGDRWFFRHLEAITVRLDKIGALPASEFPEVDSGRKLWMAEEKHITEQVRLFRFLSKEKGRDFALDWLRDGRGYLVGVKTWVPWVDPGRAFVLYLCWEQSKLHGDRVVLQRLDEKSAEVRITSNFLLLYERTAHLAKMVPRDDFVAMFEAVWRDRANQAGWSIAFDYGEKGTVTFRLSRSVDGSRAP